ncbi:MAG: response regulator [Mediterraneibacter gnavus]
MWRVMIADDEPYIREGLEKLIPWEELGCELIYVAENGQDLLEQIRSCPPDIAIIDIKMPLMDGMEVAEYIYKNHIRTSVIFLTAYADFQYARKAIQYQVSDYIVKTAALEEIPAAIANIKQRLESENMTWYRMLLVTPVRQGEKVRKFFLHAFHSFEYRALSLGMRKKDWCLQSMTVNGRRKSSVVVRNESLCKNFLERRRRFCAAVSAGR